MESGEILLTISEVSIALAGFGGIVAGLGYRSKGAWTAQDRFRLITMEATSLSIVFACLVPYSLNHLGFCNQWQIAAFLLLLIAGVNLIAQFRVVGIGLSPGFNPFFTIPIMASNLSAFTLASVLLTGIPDKSSLLGLYMAALLFLLVEPAMLFLRLILTSFTEKGD